MVRIGFTFALKETPPDPPVSTNANAFDGTPSTVMTIEPLAAPAGTRTRTSDAVHEI